MPPSSTPLLKSKTLTLSITVILLTFICGCQREPDKVLFINSYYPGFHSTDEYLAGIRDAFKGRNIELRTFNMDTKRNPQTDYIEAKAVEVMEEINTFKPDLIIASDDNAAKYVVQPHLREGPIPVLFCGVNWTCWQYDLPTPFVRGILEVLPVREVILELKKYYPEAEKLTILSELSNTELKNKEFLDPIYAELGLTPSYALVNSFQDWKREFLIANENADLIFTFTHGAIKGWQEEEAAAYVMKHIRKPIFTVEEHMMPYCVLGFSKVAREQGDWIGARALEVLAGTPVGSIEMTKNTQTKNFLNRPLADKIGFQPSKELFDSCEILENPHRAPIKDLVASSFPEGNVYIGGTTHYRRINAASGEIISREFNYLTPANAFKQTYIHPEPGEYKYNEPDAFIKYAKQNGQVMRLHAPISPQCSEWAKEDSRSPGELSANLEEYLVALYSRYSQVENVRWLDVVNETIVPETGDWMMPKKGTRSWENPWPRMGYDESHSLRPPLYIRKAFEIANKHAPKQNLIINQHGQLEPEGWETMKALVAYLREMNLRVDGVGWQAHVNVGWESEPGNTERLGKLIRWCHDNGLEFHITEFNVYLPKGDKSKFDEQADTFEAITRTVLDNRENGVVGINFWHMADPEPQRKQQGCLFDENHQPKPAYFRITDLLRSYSQN